MRKSNTFLTEVPRREKKWDMGKLTSKNFLKHMKDTNLQIQEAQRITIRIKRTPHLTLHREIAED